MIDTDLIDQNANPTVGETTRIALAVGDIVGALKSRVTVAHTRGVKSMGWPPFHGRL